MTVNSRAQIKENILPSIHISDVEDYDLPLIVLFCSQRCFIWNRKLFSVHAILQVESNVPILWSTFVTICILVSGSFTMIENRGSIMQLSIFWSNFIRQLPFFTFYSTRNFLLFLKSLTVNYEKHFFHLQCIFEHLAVTIVVSTAHVIP